MTLLPLGTDRPQRRTPWVNILLIAANVIVYMLSHRFGHPAAGIDSYFKPGPVIGSITWSDMQLYGGERGPHLELYQFLTYQFLHMNTMHILGNMLFLWVFGNNLNEKLGAIPYLLLYLTGGVCAGIGQALTTDAPTLGASGAVSAVTGLFFVLLPRTNIRIWLWFFLSPFEIPSMYFILFSFGREFIDQISDAGSHVAHFAHLVGTLSGFFIGLGLLLTGLVQRHHYDLLAMIQRWRRRRQYESMVATGFDPFRGHLPGGGSPAVFRNQGIKPAEPIVNPKITQLRDDILTLIRNHQLPQATIQYLVLRALDQRQILPADAQKDVANQLMLEGKYSDAAVAYEDFLTVYPNAPDSEKVQLLLGLVYARYWPNPKRAAELLNAVLPRLHNAADRAMAEAELKHLNIPPSDDAPKN